MGLYKVGIIFQLFTAFTKVTSILLGHSNSLGKALRLFQVPVEYAVIGDLVNFEALCIILILWECTIFSHRLWWI